MKKLKEILKKVKDILIMIEDKFLFLVPGKYRKAVRNIINILILITGTVLGILAIF